MKKNILTLVFVALLALILVACDPTTTEEESDLTRITITFTDNVSIEYGTTFDVMAGVTAVGDDEVDYTDQITYTSASTISSAGLLNTTSPGDVLINYRVTVGNVIAQRTRSLRVEAEVILEWVGYSMSVEQSEGQVAISYEGITGNWWEKNAQLPVVDFDGTKNSISFTFTGVAGHTYLFKIEGGGVFKETPIEADGTEQVHTLDLSLMTEAQRNGLNLIIVFVQTSGASGTIVVKDWTYGEQLEVTEPEWNGVGMTVDQTEGQVTITYEGITANWWEKNAQLPVVGFTGSETAVSFTFTGVAGHTYLFKIEGPGGVFVETPIEADGTEQVHTLDLSAMTVAQRESLNLIVVFVQTLDAQGSVVVKDWVYGVVEPEEPVESVWTGYGMEAVETEDDVTITYADISANWWEKNAQLPISGFDGTKNSVAFTFTGVDGHEYLFKIEGPGGINKEEPIVADGTEQTVTLDLTLMTEAQRNSLNLIIVFVKTEGASGSFTVNTWAYGEQLEEAAPEWAGYGMTVDNTGENVVITFANTPGAWWDQNAQLPVVGFDGDQTSVSFTFVGIEGQSYLFKVEGPGVAVELAVVATGVEQVHTIDLSGLTPELRSGINKLVFFSNVEGQSGTVEIISVS